MDPSNPTKYRLIYFNFMGKAETIRLLFALARVPYDDVRISKAEWPQYKPKMPWGQIPVLELVQDDGRQCQLAQSLTILRYLATKFGLCGKTEMEMAKCDEYIDAMSDFVKECVTHYFETDPDKKASLGKKLEEEVKPKFLTRLETILDQEGTGLLVGDSLTHADLYIADMLSRNKNVNSLKDYPLLARHQELVLKQKDIADYIAKRPETPM